MVLCNTSSLLALVLMVGCLALVHGKVIQIHISSSAFPLQVKVNVGDTVQWINQDPLGVHTVASDDGSFASGFIYPGQDFVHRFVSEGVWGYGSTMPGMNMHGYIVVGNITWTPPSPSVPSVPSPTPVTKPPTPETTVIPPQPQSDPVPPEVDPIAAVTVNAVSATVLAGEKNPANRINRYNMANVTVGVTFEGKGSENAVVRISDRYNTILSPVMQVESGYYEFSGIHAGSLENGIVEVSVQIFNYHFMGTPALKGIFISELDAADMPSSNGSDNSSTIDSMEPSITVVNMFFNDIFV